MQRRRVFLSVAAVVSLFALSFATGGVAHAADVSATGRFESPFSENGDFNANPPLTIAESTRYPTAVSSVVLPKYGTIAYWNGLENLESDPFPLAADAPSVAKNSRSRVLDLSDPENMSVPTPEDGGASDLFCADLKILLDGSVLVTGGTLWRFDPIANPLADQGLPGGTAELFGARHARVLSANGTQWDQTASMHRGRWYPAMVTLPDGKLFVAGGVGRLLYNAPIFQNGDFDEGADGQQASGTNIEQSETFDPYVGGLYKPLDGKWVLNENDTTTFPLFARLRVLPNGKVFYDGVGQMWGPFGQGYDQALWNVMKTYDPATRTWADAGIGSYGALSGAVSVLLPFKQAADGSFGDAKILHAGGTIGTSPGGFLATDLAEIVTVGADGQASAQRLDSRLNNRRWYSSSSIGPDGKVYIFSGADKDEVVAPGQERAVRQAEVFDPATGQFTALATMDRDRTYHNSAVLLRDGRFLIGGHSPINNLYGPGADDAGSEHDVTGQIEDATGLPVGTANNLKDPSFQIFTPPYLLNADGSLRERPAINENSGNPLFEWGSVRNIALDDEGAGIEKAMLIHVPATTHTVDGDHRAIELALSNVTSSNFDITVPANKNVAPPGWYYLYAIDKNGVPSVANIVRVGDTATFSGAASFTPAQPTDSLAPLSKRVSKAPANAAPVVTAPAARTRPVRSRTTSPALYAVAAAAMVLAAASVRRVRRVRA